MEKNFNIPDSVTIKAHGKLLDLHNDFCLTSIQYLANGQSLLMVWHPTQYYSDNNLCRIELKFEKIKRLSANVKKLEENPIISFIGYNDENNFSQGRYFVSESDFQRNHGITIAFEGGSYISIGAERASVEVISTAVRGQYT